MLVFLTLPAAHPWTPLPSRGTTKQAARFADAQPRVDPSQRLNYNSYSLDPNDGRDESTELLYAPCPLPGDPSREAEAWRAVGMPAVVARVARHASTVPGAERCLRGACLAQTTAAAREQYAAVAEALQLLATGKSPPLEHDLDLTGCLGAGAGASSAAGGATNSNATLSLAELAQVAGAVKALKALAQWATTPAIQQAAPRLAACVDFGFEAHPSLPQCLAQLHHSLDGAVVVAAVDRSKPSSGAPPVFQLASRKWPALDAARAREASLRSEVRPLCTRG